MIPEDMPTATICWYLTTACAKLNTQTAQSDSTAEKCVDCNKFPHPFCHKWLLSAAKTHSSYYLIIAIIIAAAAAASIVVTVFGTKSPPTAAGKN
eukprot:scaffold115377_cov19-Prasinocladus_malaysianus.AAC.1